MALSIHSGQARSRALRAVTARCRAIAKGMAVEIVESAKLISTDEERSNAVGKIAATVTRIVRLCRKLARDLFLELLEVTLIVASEREAGN